MGGRNEAVLRLLPPLTVTEEIVAEAVGIIGRALVDQQQVDQRQMDEQQEVLCSS